jgi:pectin methylesterase-like acyl-CoA thioesterase
MPSFSQGGKHHLFLLDIRAGIRAPELQVFPFKIIKAAQYQGIYFTAVVNRAVRSAVSDRSGTSDLKYIEVKKYPAAYIKVSLLSKT